MIPNGCAGRGRLAAGVAALLLLPLGGCVPESKFADTVHEYQTASHNLGTAAGELLAHANTVEAESYIDTQTFLRQPLSQPEIDNRAVLSGDGLRLRMQAIDALSAYTLALASLASGQAEEKVAADAMTAGTGLAALTVDLQAAVTRGSAATTTVAYDGVVQGAVSSAGELIGLLERRHSREAVRESLRKNDPAVATLFSLIGTDAERIYARQRLGVENRGVTLYGRYAASLRQEPGDAAYAMELGDRIKRFGRDTELLARSDPAPAFRAWKKAHDDLVAYLLGGQDAKGRKALLQQLMTDVDAFAGVAQPLAADVHSLIGAT